MKVKYVLKILSNQLKINNLQRCNIFSKKIVPVCYFSRHSFL